MSSEINHESIKVKRISGRYVTLEDVLPVLKDFKQGKLSCIGKSVQGREIQRYKVGYGKIKVLLWSQMHGNESTTTKGLLDFLNFLETENALDILGRYTFFAIPILNPDGAKAYTRTNANNVDLNRDFQDFSQPESRLLIETLDEINPDLCFNLHDQRSIFGVGNPPEPATISFLAPAFNDEREFNDCRMVAVSKVVAMAKRLECEIPGQIGRFDDVFNPNCVGDCFQLRNVPTVLIEAGHFESDYDRETTRKFVFTCLSYGFQQLLEIDVVGNDLVYYLNIPQNNPIFYDFVYRNVKINYDGNEIITNFAAQLEGRLFKGNFKMTAIISEFGLSNEKIGHIEYECSKMLFQNHENAAPKVGELASFNIGEQIFVNGTRI